MVDVGWTVGCSPRIRPGCGMATGAPETGLTTGRPCDLELPCLLRHPDEREGLPPCAVSGFDVRETAFVDAHLHEVCSQTGFDGSAVGQADGASGVQRDHANGTREVAVAVPQHT